MNSSGNKSHVWESNYKMLMINVAKQNHYLKGKKNFTFTDKLRLKREVILIQCNWQRRMSKINNCNLKLITTVHKLKT